VSAVPQGRVADRYGARPPVAEILQAHGRRLAAVLTVFSLIAIVAYLIFDFDLIAVVAVPLVVGGIEIARTVFEDKGRSAA
jgi:hypothetical protein